MAKIILGAAAALTAALAAATVAGHHLKVSGKWGHAESILKVFGEECGTPIEKLRKVAEAMVVEMHAGLASEGGSKLKMLISYVDNLPSGFFSFLLLHKFQYHSIFSVSVFGYLLFKSL